MAVGGAMEPAGGAAKPWPLRQRFRIPYHAIDAMNHLNHAAYFPMMETLRCAYYLPMLGSSDPTDLDIIVAEAACRYVQPVVYGEEIDGEVAPVLPLGTTSFTLLYRFTNAVTSTVVARGRTVLVTYDYDRSRKVPIPAERRARFERDAVDGRGEGW